MRFLNNFPAIKIGRCLVVADLHIGITKDIYDKGIFIPSQSEKMAGKINKLKTITKTNKLILLGDVKHKIYGFSIHEKNELEGFFSRLKYKNIVIVKGNHDGDIERMIPQGKKISVKKSVTIGRYFLTHGHRNITTSKKTIIIGHNQPHVKFRDKMGGIYIEPVWIIGMAEKKKIIIMPAFNELCGATVVNKDELLGPIAKSFDKKNAKVYLLDGTDIGTISSLKVD
ncbi:metallophosphoesterase [archaeon]|nr:metallophosphoesterase [archaeon]